MMKKIAGFILVLAMILTPISAFATDSYSDDISSRLQQALSDTLFSWTKVFSVPHAYQEQNKSPWAGAGKGVVDAIHCTVAGAFNLLTFPVAAQMSAEACVDLEGGAGTPMTEDWEGARVPK